MSIWKLQELRDLIEKVHGPEQLRKAASHIDSIDWKLRAAGYHSHTANNAFSSVFENVGNEAASAVKMMLSSGEEASEFREARLIYEANVIACAQAMHSVTDIISHVVLYAVPLTGMDEENLYLKSIQKHVPNSKLKDQIVRVSGLRAFRYLQDFVNTTKHLKLVDTEYTVDLTGEALHAHGIKFNAFVCKRRSHPEKWGDELLKELRQLSIEFVNLGQEVNNYLLLKAD